MSVIPFPRKRSSTPSGSPHRQLRESGPGQPSGSSPEGSLLRLIEERPLQTALAVFFAGILIASATSLASPRKRGSGGPE